jgi:beta-xylosidase
MDEGLPSSRLCRIQHELIAQMPKQASYRNPVLFADYSDPDVIRDGDNYYLVSSSFGFVPGISEQSS